MESINHGKAGEERLPNTCEGREINILSKNLMDYRQTIQRVLFEEWVVVNNSLLTGSSSTYITTRHHWADPKRTSYATFLKTMIVPILSITKKA